MSHSFDPNVIAAVINGVVAIWTAYLQRRIKHAEKDIDGLGNFVGTEKGLARANKKKENKMSDPAQAPAPEKKNVFKDIAEALLKNPKVQLALNAVLIGVIATLLGTKAESVKQFFCPSEVPPAAVAGPLPAPAPAEAPAK